MNATLPARGGKTDERYDSYEGVEFFQPPRGLEGGPVLGTSNEPWNVAKGYAPEASVSGIAPGMRILAAGAVALVYTVAPGLGGGVMEIARMSGGVPGGATSAPSAVYVTPVGRSREEDTVGTAPTTVAPVRAVTAGEQVLAVKAALGLSATEISRVLNVSRATVHTWMRGAVQVPQDQVVQQRLYALYRMAQAWTERTGTGLGRLARAAVLGDGVALVTLLEAQVWDQAAITWTLDVLAESVRAADSAYARHRPLLTGTVEATPDELAAVEAMRNRRALQRLRSLRHRG